MSVVVNPPSLGNSVSVVAPNGANKVSITSPNPANKVVINPPSGGNLVTVLAGIAGPTGPTGPTPMLSVNTTVATLGYGNNGIASIGGTLPNNPKLYLTLPAGSDASVTSANITSALGYTPIGDAPDTLHQYARTKGAWQSIQTGNPFNQTLNTTSDVRFNSISLSGKVFSDPASGLIIGDTSSNFIILRSTGELDIYGGAQLYSEGPIYGSNINEMASQADAPDTLHQYARVKGAWQTISGGGGSSNQLTNGSYSVVLDSLGNTTFPNATVESSGLVVSQGVGSYDTIGVGSTGSLGYGLNNIALNPDGSASFANGGASIDGIGSVNITAPASSNSVLKVGALEFQPYSVNNVWFGDNAYYDGSFKYRSNGSAGLFYFQGGSGEEGQFRMASAGNSGDTFEPTTQLKIAYTGEFGVGSSISTSTGAFDGSSFYVDGGGNASLAGNLTAANIPDSTKGGVASVAQAIAFSIALS